MIGGGADECFLPSPLSRRLSPYPPPRAIAEGRPIPTELRRDEAALREEIALEDAATRGGAGPASGGRGASRDDEYGRAGEADPKLMLTTSRDPSSRLTAFCKELKLIFPNAQRINRGNQVTSALVEACRTADFTDLVIVHEHRGEPDGEGGAGGGGAAGPPPARHTSRLCLMLLCFAPDPPPLPSPVQA